jgi:hypothetical protein
MCETKKINTFVRQIVGCGLVLSLSANLHAETFTITSFSGNAQLGSTPQSYIPAVVKNAYPLKTWAKTPAGSSLVVEFSADNIFRLLPNSEIQVMGAGETNAKFRRVVRLTTGSVALDLNALPKGSEIKVETPTAVCGAVGTVFTADANTGKFDCSRGHIYARSEQEKGFQADSISGSVTLAPGQENSFASADVTGDFSVNGRKFSGQSVQLRLAKAKGGASTSAVEITGGGADLPKGVYLMDGGKLQPINSGEASLHQEYLSAAQKEGSLNLQKQSSTASGQTPSPGLDAELAAATRKATELRNKLFARGVMRDVARDTVKEITRGNTRPPH